MIEKRDCIQQILEMCLHVKKVKIFNLLEPREFKSITNISLFMHDVLDSEQVTMNSFLFIDHLASALSNSFVVFQIAEEVRIPSLL